MKNESLVLLQRNAGLNLAFCVCRDAGLVFWNKDADLAFGRRDAHLKNVGLVLLQRNESLSLMFYICKTDCRILDLFSMGVTPSSTFSILVESQELLRTLANLKLWSLERRKMVGLAFIIILTVS